MFKLERTTYILHNDKLKVVGWRRFIFGRSIVWILFDRSVVLIHFSISRLFEFIFERSPAGYGNVVPTPLAPGTGQFRSGHIEVDSLYGQPQANMVSSQFTFFYFDFWFHTTKVHSFYKHLELLLLMYISDCH
jgi:hypothetical protein